MPGVFRRRWFPRPKSRGALPVLNSTNNLTGLQSNTIFGSFSEQLQFVFTGDPATTSVGALTPTYSFSTPGVAATTALGTFSLPIDSTVSGDVAASAVGSFGVPQISDNTDLTGNQVTVSVGNLRSDHPAELLTGLSVTTQFGILAQTRIFNLYGLFVTTGVPDPAFFVSKVIDLPGLQVFAIAFSAVGAGGGGGGAAGLYGIGQSGFGGAATGTGGRGGDADNHTVLGALVPGAAGLNGNELAPGYGSGSGGAGASFNAGAGSLVYNYDGTITIWYVSSITALVTFINLTSANNASSPFQIPDDWTNQNAISLTGSGCTDHGSITNINNSTAFSPNQLVAFHASTFCSGADTTFGSYSAASGTLTPTINGQIGGDGGLYGGGGGGGTGGGGGRGADGLIFVQYKSTSDHTIKTIIFKVVDNQNSPWTVPADWSQSNFVYLQCSGGCGGRGSTTQGGRGGGGGGISGAYDTTAFTPGQVIPYHVSSGCSGLPTVFGSFVALPGANGDDDLPTLGIVNLFSLTIPCDGTTGDGTVGPPRP